MCHLSSSRAAPTHLALAAALALAPIATSTFASTEADLARLDSVVVTGTRSSHTLAGVPVDTVLVTREDIDRSPAQNLPQLLREIPGLAVTNLDDTLAADNLRLTMRGLQVNEGYGLVLIDGRRIHGGLGAHGDYGISLNQVPLAMVERIEIVRGASSALYGADAMAGVINIITRKIPVVAGGSAALGMGRYRILPRDGVEPNDEHRTDLKLHASYGAPVGQSSGFLLLAGREQDESTDSNAQLTYRDSALARWHTRFGSGWSGELQADAARSRRETVNRPERFDRRYDDRRWAAALRHEGMRHDWRLSGYRFTQEFEQGYPGFTHGYRFGDIGYDQLETQYTWLGDRQWITAGAEFQRQELDYLFNNYANGVLAATVPVGETIDTVSVYLQDEIWLLDRRLMVVPAARFEDHSVFGGELNPKLAVRYAGAGERTVLRASVGRAFKSPTIRQLYYEGLYRHGEFYIESNPDLDPERAINFNASVEQRWDARDLRLSVGVHQTDVSDKVVRTDTGRVAADGIPIQSYVNVEEARIRGLELSLRLGDARGWSLQAGAAWTEAENLDTGNDLPYVPDYTLTLAPTWVAPGGRSGTRLALAAIGEQYRNTANTQLVEAHRIVDVRAWHELKPGVVVNLDLNNLFESDKGDDAFAWRQGRRIGLSLDLQF
ncbi:TonB-dependent receptor [Thioalkalivibrio sp. XN8]|uniref:TonB-dependent receptor plug domain-containing protein n=1 Tax=Thioalkalivibrio sp. XN8 TaxID=2712863 RepID=UPI0013EA37F6|nr:TonB-dependent receptor [Thioalkalivibrio sp. XN8]NGP53879.1 TonB-dependent receptor [Thioalkalivibrio sp. XN8]